MNTRVNIEKRRMEVAYNSSEISGKKAAKEFESSVNKIPAFVHTNGIGNTFAYLASNQNKSQWKNVIIAIENWLKNEYSGFSNSFNKANGQNAEKLLNLVKDIDDTQNKALTNEILAYFNWLRKFAKANKIKVDEENEKNKTNG